MRHLFLIARTGNAATNEGDHLNGGLSNHNGGNTNLNHEAPPAE